MYRLKLFDGLFAVCRLNDLSGVDLNDQPFFLANTGDECSLICREHCAPASASERRDGYHLFRIEGTLDFSLVGVLHGIAATLAAAQISLLAVSTYDTDYFLVQDTQIDRAVAALTAAGYAFERVE